MASQSPWQAVQRHPLFGVALGGILGWTVALVGFLTGFRLGPWLATGSGVVAFGLIHYFDPKHVGGRCVLARYDYMGLNVRVARIGADLLLACAITLLIYGAAATFGLRLPGQLLLIGTLAFTFGTTAVPVLDPGRDPRESSRHDDHGVDGR